MLITRLYWTAYLAFHLRGQATYAFQPLETIRRDQARRTHSIVTYAYRHVPYYRETMKRPGLLPADFQSADDLTKLPVIERNQLKRDPEYFVSQAQPIERYLRLRTGGSTGEPRTVYHDLAALFQSRAHHERERSIITRELGRSWGYRQLLITSPLSSARDMQRFMQAYRLTVPGARILQDYASLMDPPDQIAQLLNERKPDVLQSYGSYLEILFGYLQATGQTCHLPKVITFTSDGLSDSIRRLITDTYHIPVFSTYQAIEALRIGFECEHHSGLHVNIDLCPVRIVDDAGRNVPAGQSGEVIISNLINRATVLLNYRLGDVAAWLPAPCPCGRTLPLMSFPQGRSDDLIVLASGRIMHPQAVRIIFTNEQDIWQYQVVQETATRLSIKLVASPACNRQLAAERIAAGFARTFGQEIIVDISFVDALPRTRAGKSRPVLSMLQKNLTDAQHG